MVEGLLADACDGGWDGHTCQRSTFFKCLRANVGNGIRNIDLFELMAQIKCAIPDSCESVGEDNACEGAIQECAIPDHCDGVGKYDAFDIAN